LGRKF